MFKHHVYIAFLVIGLLASCSAHKPFHTERVTAGIQSYSNNKLKDLPKPSEQIVAAVYRFRDQTGQYKPSESIASWSTAVTQGATSILIKSMEDSGWFIPIEREGLSNLLNERQIIQQIRAQNAAGQQTQPLPPLLFAGVILEGGIIGYDTNIITGGAGARYLGTGAQQQFRKDQITIYLRAVSSQSGRVLKTIHTTKSIISYQMDSGVFRYIDTNRLLEAEIGYTYNEPPVLAVTEAIDEALRLLIIEGIEDELWAVKDTTELNDYLATYSTDTSSESLSYFGLKNEENRAKGTNVGLSALNANLIGNYQNPYSSAGFQLDFQHYLPTSNNLSVNVSLFRTQIGFVNAFREPVNGIDVQFFKDLLDKTYISPFIGIGGSILRYDRAPSFLTSNQPFFSATISAGINYRISNRIDFRASYNLRYLLSDNIDGFSNSSINDQLWNLQGGLIFKNLFN